MNEATSEMDKQLRDTPDVSFVIAIDMNKGKRNACLFLGIIALAVILLGAWEFGWSKWLLLLPAALGIGSLLYQINILVVFSELKRHYEMKKLQGLHEKRDEEQRRLAFMESHEEIIYARLQEYLNENPDVDDIPAEVTEHLIEECFLEHEIAELEAKIAEGQQMDEGERRLAFVKNHKEIIQARFVEYLEENPDDDEVPDEVARQIIEECFLEQQIADLEAEIAEAKAETAQLSEAEELDEPRWRRELRGQDRIVFGCTVAFWAGIAGAIVGVLWALALSLSLIFGAILGACINAVFWVIACLAATASGRITPKEAVCVMGSVMTLLCSLLTIVALVVWVIRLLL